MGLMVERWVVEPWSSHEDPTSAPLSRQLHLVEKALGTTAAPRVQPLAQLASQPVVCRPPKLVRLASRPQEISLPLGEFDDFGFVPGHPVLWTSTLALGSTEQDGGLRCVVDLAHVGCPSAAQEDLALVQSFVPTAVSWWGRGLSCSANGLRMAYILPGASPRSLRVIDLAPGADQKPSRTGVELPLGRCHGRIQLSADGLLCAIEREHDIAVWDVSVAATPLCTMPRRPGRVSEVALLDHRQFYLATRERTEARLSLEMFALRSFGFERQASFSVRRSTWHVCAQPTTGRVTLWDEEADKLTSIDPHSSTNRVWDHCANVSESFPPLVSPLGRYFVMQDQSAARNIVIAAIHEDTNTWQEWVRRSAGPLVWRSALFSPRETHVALLYDCPLSQKLPRPTAGVCVLDLQEPQCSAQYFLYNREVARVQFSCEGDRLAVKYRAVGGRAHPEERPFRVHVWSLVEPVAAAHSD